MKSTIKILCLMSLSLWMMACSQVNFAPVPKIEQSRNETPEPDGKIHETFRFDNDSTERRVDVMFIVDNSTSMTAEQEKLGQRLNSFIGSLSQVDWQIGITTTDVSAGSFGIRGSLVDLEGTTGHILKPTTPNYSAVFMDNVVREETLDCQVTAVCPTSNEQPLRASMMAMDKRNTDNVGFFRSNADLAIVILSDEDEMSSGPAEATKPQAVIDHFKAIFGTRKKLAVFAIVVEPGDTDCASKQGITGGSYGSHASALALQTGGFTGSICDDDYSESLQKIGENVSKLLDYVVLKNDPAEEGMELSISPFDPTLTWTIEGRRITFNKTPNEGTRIDVIYSKQEAVEEEVVP